MAFYRVEWKPDRFQFKIDNLLIYRVTGHMTDFYGGWPFDRAEYLLLNFALSGNFPFKVNGIENRYFGLPQLTVQIIKEDKIRLLVDWVKVTQS